LRPAHGKPLLVLPLLTTLLWLVAALVAKTGLEVEALVDC
jgi:hypothetical protein